MNYQRIVIKLGTSTLTAGTPYLSLPRMVDLARQIADLHKEGKSVVVVSSGAMAAGRETIGFPQLPKEIPVKQMLAAIGQPRLMAVYTQLFGLYAVNVAQILLTKADLENRRRYLNARNTLRALTEQGVLAVVNENDSVATEEIRVGDNDNLSALVANLIDADLLLLLTDQEGLFTEDPRKNPAAQLIQEIGGDSIPAEIWQAASGSKGSLGTGGMVTKLQAAELARRSGTTVVIAKGSLENVILRVVRREQIGTRFVPSVSSVDSRTRYLLAGGRTIGKVKVDQGAVQALHSGGSLLPVGVVSVQGKFERGDSVRIIDSAEIEIGIGITNYSSNDLQQIGGLHSSDIPGKLGYHYGDEIIHRNNLVLF